MEAAFKQREFDMLASTEQLESKLMDQVHAAHRKGLSYEEQLKMMQCGAQTSLNATEDRQRELQVLPASNNKNVSWYIVPRLVSQKGWWVNLALSFHGKARLPSHFFFC